MQGRWRRDMGRKSSQASGAAPRSQTASPLLGAALFLLSPRTARTQPPGYTSLRGINTGDFREVDPRLTTLATKVLQVTSLLLVGVQDSVCWKPARRVIAPEWQTRRLRLPAKPPRRKSVGCVQMPLPG